MSENKHTIDIILDLEKSTVSKNDSNKYQKLGLKFNPFPRSGVANMASSDIVTEKLIPVKRGTLDKISAYIRGALVPNEVVENDKLATGVIIGNYGMGKTQLLLFVKALLSQLHTSQYSSVNSLKPYVIYIDNPGVSISELIGEIIRDIGEENFRKFLWRNIILRMERDKSFVNRLKKFIRPGTLAMFESNRNEDPFHETNKVNYKLFIESFLNRIPTLKERRSFEIEIKQIIIAVLRNEFIDGVLAEYFYDIVSNDLGLNSTWEAFISGSGKHLEGKESDVIKIIFRIVREQGFTNFFVLVDEFEDISQGRLSKPKLDNYLYNLRILLDENREWCLLFAMVPDAFRQIRKVSLPLAQRISVITIELDKLTSDDAKFLLANYLQLATDIENNIKPFTVQAVKYLNSIVEIDGTPRTLLQACFSLIEEAARKNVEEIDETFVKENLVF
ncbi:MAG TPA: hypothetical protein VK622_04640 [Puia sp.]|nr:hypothetical protein [Puia sp.]